MQPDQDAEIFNLSNDHKGSNKVYNHSDADPNLPSSIEPIAKASKRSRNFQIDIMIDDWIEIRVIGCHLLCFWQLEMR